MGVTAFEKAPWLLVKDARCEEIATDASSGWGLGAHWGAKLWAQQHLREYKGEDIYLSELRAIAQALQLWGEELQGYNVAIMCDNSTAVSMLLKGAGDRQAWPLLR